MGGVEYQVTKVDPTDPETKGMVYQVHKVSEEVAATLGGKVYRARIIKDPTEPTVAGKVYQIVLIDDPDDPSVKGKVYNAILTGGSEAVVVGPAVSPLDLPDAVAEAIDSLIAYGGTEQNGTPTPSTPVDIVCNNGTIKFSPNEANYTADNVVLGYWLRNSDGQPEASSANFYTAMIPVKPNTSYVCFGRTKDTNVISGYNRIAWYDAGGVWIRNSTYTANTPGIDTSPANAAFARFHCNPSGATVTQELVDSYNWVFQIGAAEVPYIPYSAVNPYVEGTQEIIVVTHNEFDPTDESAQFSGYVQNVAVGSMTRLVAYNGGDKCLIFPVKAGNTYRFTRPTNIDAKYDRIRVAASVGIPSASTTDNMLMIFNLYGNTTTPSGTFTIPEGYDYIAINVRNSGAVGTDWQTYLDGVSLCNLSEPSVTCENLLAIGDYVDSQDVISGEVTRKVGVKVFDGTEDWTANTVSSGRLVFYVTKASVGSDSTALPNGSPNIKCSHFETSTAAAQSLYGTVWAGGTAINFTAGDFCANLTAWKQWLANQYAAGTPVIIVYPLAAATTEAVAGQPMETIDGDNVAEITQASIDGLQLEVEYEKESV